jgi:hypothetical protein
VSGNTEIVEQVDAFIESQRTRCLWFARENFRPANDVERLAALDSILRHGDRAAFARASELKRWLSQSSKNESAAY